MQYVNCFQLQEEKDEENIQQKCTVLIREEKEKETLEKSRTLGLALECQLPIIPKF